jgi:hypothetical protein
MICQTITIHLQQTVNRLITNDSHGIRIP